MTRRPTRGRELLGLVVEQGGLLLGLVMALATYYLGSLLS